MRYVTRNSAVRIIMIKYDLVSTALDANQTPCQQERQGAPARIHTGPLVTHRGTERDP